MQTSGHFFFPREVQIEVCHYIYQAIEIGNNNGFCAIIKFRLPELLKDAKFSQIIAQAFLHVFFEGETCRGGKKICFVTLECSNNLWKFIINNLQKQTICKALFSMPTSNPIQKINCTFQIRVQYSKHSEQPMSYICLACFKITQFILNARNQKPHQEKFCNCFGLAPDLCVFLGAPISCGCQYHCQTNQYKKSCFVYCECDPYQFKIIIVLVSEERGHNHYFLLFPCNTYGNSINLLVISFLRHNFSRLKSLEKSSLVQSSLLITHV